MATSTHTLIVLVTLMLACNISLVFVQGAMVEVNPASVGISGFDAGNTPYANYVVNNSLNLSDSYLPSDDSVEGDSTGNVFTDTYKAIKGWSREKMSPLNFMANVLKQPYGFLKDVGIPINIALAIGVLWYMVAIIIVVSWWMGR